MAKKTEPKEEKKKGISPWWLLAPIVFAIVVIWVTAYVLHIANDTWIEVPTVITSALLLAIDFISFLAMTTIVEDIA